MKKRSFGVLLTVAIVLVLSLALVASASAAPSLTSVDPTGKSASNVGNFQLKIYGQSLTDFIGTPSVYLEQVVWPYDEIQATNVTVVPMLGGDYISCEISTYHESAGAYNVVVAGWWLIGQPVQYLTLPGAFTVTGSPPTTNPYIASIRPESATAGGAGFTLTVNGANFVTGLVNPSVVYWNSTPLATTPGGLPNPTAVCTAAVPAALIANPGNAMITVHNPLLGGDAVSNAVAFSITTPLPTLTSLNPATTWANFVTPPSVVLTGTNFQSTAQVLVNGAVHASTYVSATQMTVQLTAADIASAGTLNFAVRIGSSGTPTATLPFTVNAETTAPVVTISGADDLWHNQPVVLTVNATDSQSGVQKIMYSIGTMPATVLVGTTITVPGPQGGVTNGVNEVSVYAIDNCNTSSTPVKATVNTCTSGPDTEAFAPSSVKKGKTCKISYVCNSITPQCNNIKIKIYNSSGVVKKSVNGGTKASNQKYTIQFNCNLSPGKYKVRVYATDAAGNPQDSMDTDSFQVTK